jgi:K+-sensing histidine kinase KdpD
MDEQRIQQVLSNVI